MVDPCLVSRPNVDRRRQFVAGVRTTAGTVCFSSTTVGRFMPSAAGGRPPAPRRSSPAPQCDQQLARRRHDHGLRVPRAFAVRCRYHSARALSFWNIRKRHASWIIPRGTRALPAPSSGCVRKLLPFPLLGFHTDNDSVFMKETARDYIVVTLLRRGCYCHRKNIQRSGRPSPR
jgi:hypothetical protein